ncbi:hypothetical protein N7466_002913 [Penicillium verhagenii]|uniref:uncharacterized protein n=1 Tax=Penicillium verhagenii TaxID=1562060 RepID=UPI0025457645|nr:uncharacterized protein N7466_002913 [Penicillium verhagenii]KAJ5939779.1 hypothetical protein N7466_002913 [Penicillium verhagenii]
MLFCDRSQLGKRFFRPCFPSSKSRLLGRGIRQLLPRNTRMRRNLSDYNLVVVRWIEGCGRFGSEGLDVGINCADDELSGGVLGILYCLDRSAAVSEDDQFLTMFLGFELIEGQLNTNNMVRAWVVSSGACAAVAGLSGFVI